MLLDKGQAINQQAYKQHVDNYTKLPTFKFKLENNIVESFLKAVSTKGLKT